MADKPRTVVSQDDMKWAQMYMKQANLTLDVASKFTDTERRQTAERHAEELMNRAITRTRYHPLESEK